MNIVILAAGRSSRFENKKSKLVQPFNGTTVIEEVVQHAQQAIRAPLTVIVNHQEDLIRAILGKRVMYFRQDPLNGAGGALQQWVFNSNADNETLAILGDLPLLSSKSIGEFYWRACLHDMAFMTVKTNRPEFMWVQYKDEIPQSVTREPVSGIGDVGCYYFKTAWLKEKLPLLKQVDGQMTINQLVQHAEDCWSYRLTDEQEAWGVNTVEDLLTAQGILKK